MKVSVIITAHNYGKYISEAIDSVLTQTYDDYEIIIVNDGSTDNTTDILSYYKENKNNEHNIKVINLPGIGLAKAANTGIRESSGEYIIRLDADDYFDENILHIMTNVLDKNPNIHMVYPDYYRVTKYGEVIDYCRLAKVNDEIKLLDRSPLAAGAMFRRLCFDALCGYNEELKYQEDYDFWIRFIDKYTVYNVNLPLMYYRKHGSSMSNNFDGRMTARHYVKKKFVDEKGYRSDKHILGVIPAMGLFRNKEKLALKQIGGKALISHTIEAALKSDYLSDVIVSTEDQEIKDVAIEYGAHVPFLRPMELARTSVHIKEILVHMINVFEDNNEKIPDIIVVLQYLSPFRLARHIDEAVDTLLLYNTDSVISVVTDLSFHWKPGEYGLQPVGNPDRPVRDDKETVYKENASIYVIKKENLFKNGHMLGKSIGHIEMSRKESWRIETDFDLWIAEKILND